jgi:hypothetical protein
MIDREQYVKVAGIAAVLLALVLALALYGWYMGVWETPNAP